MSKLCLIILIGSIFLLTSCTDIPTAENLSLKETDTLIPSSTQISPTAIVVSTVTPQPTKRPKEETSLPASRTPSITNTSTIPPEAKLNMSCFQVVEKFPNEALVEGTLVLGGNQDQPEDYLWNLETGEKTYLPENSYPDFAVSPDGKWLAFTELGESEDWIRLMTADGQRQTLEHIEDWFGIIGWLDNENLIVEKDTEPYHSTVIFNPFTGQKQEFTSEYPEIYLFDVPYRGWEQYAFTASVYDPQLTRVVYPATLSDNPTKLNYVVWDLKAHRMITNLEVKSASVIKHGAVWSPSGKEFIVAYPTREDSRTYIPDEELYSVSRDGQVTKLTNLSANFTTGVDIRLYSWSPDGRYIAFWMDPNPPSGTHDPKMVLAVLELETQEVTTYCVRGDFRDGGWTPIWAPNSRQLLVKSLTEKNTGRVVIVDIVQEYVVQIADDLSPYGWMDFDP